MENVSPTYLSTSKRLPTKTIAEYVTQLWFRVLRALVIARKQALPETASHIGTRVFRFLVVAYDEQCKHCLVHLGVRHCKWGHR